VDLILRYPTKNRILPPVWEPLNKKNIEMNSKVSKVETLCGATSNVQHMARGQSVIPAVQTLYEALLTIQLTSVEAERTVSACGLFATKLRCRQNDSTLDALFFLNKVCGVCVVNKLFI